MCTFDGRPLDDFEPDWMRQAACAGEEHRDAFIVSPFGPRAVDEAKAVCVRCPVQANCLEFALAGDEREGIWGGMTTRERDNLRRRRVVQGI